MCVNVRETKNLLIKLIVIFFTDSLSPSSYKTEHQNRTKEKTFLGITQKNIKETETVRLEKNVFVYNVGVLFVILQKNNNLKGPKNIKALEKGTFIILQHLDSIQQNFHCVSYVEKNILMVLHTLFALLKKKTFEIMSKFVGTC